MDWRTWISGLVSALSGALVTGITTMIAEPQSFNLETGKARLAFVCGFSAVVALFNYLKASPLPPKQ